MSVPGFIESLYVATRNFEIRNPYVFWKMFPFAKLVPSAKHLFGHSHHGYQFFCFRVYLIWSRSVLDIRTKRYCVHKKKADDVFNALCAMDVSVLYWAHGGSCEVTMLARLYNQNFLWSKIIHLLRTNFKFLEGRGRGNGVISSYRHFSFR